ncbi:myotubularin-related protein 8-like [Amphibalanus amphitrite]|uniref:myotubularin-related protein 8-like n=1 Tax=Amphibalanus amphitrite TaxID=1232801 RepID=UPI001C911F0B|nr:myotubularin-related protein 8-like [Amphibalanus amphitrite]
MEIIKKPKVEKVRMLERFTAVEPAPGTLYLTATHLIFVDPRNKKETWISHMHIASVEKLPLTPGGSPLLVRCKNFRSATFVIQREPDCHDIYTSLLQLSQPVELQDLYCFQYTPRSTELRQEEGWNIYNLRDDFRRMGVPNSAWTLTDINESYEVCDTYPPLLAVPAAASTAVLIGCARFRSKGRLPVLSYRHHNQASICRCSQPLSGFKARCLEDEQMLELVRLTNPSDKLMYVVDTRPKINAMANRASGKGYENESFYQNIKFHFFGIENIHVMRHSLSKLVETCESKTSAMSSFLSGLEASGWLRHIRTTLEAAQFVASSVEAGTTVLVHCSDGWDRTSQTCGLAELLLDPYYRSLHGFQALIERVWLAHGHKFTDRCGFIQQDPKEISPIFTQFVEAVWQLTQLQPQAFQFNERYLLTLHDHVFSCQFGTFIGNCHKDRQDLRLSERTYSLWGYMAHHRNEYLNPLYDPTLHPGCLKVNLAPQTIRFWRGMYTRFEFGVHPRDSLAEVTGCLSDHNSSLRDHIRLMEKRIAQLESRLNNAADGENHGGADSTSGTEKLSERRHIHDQVNANLQLPPLTADQLTRELDSVAIEWASPRGVRECSCTTAFDHFSKKFHCWRCGEIFCQRCLDRCLRLPGHLGGEPSPVCRPCYRLLTSSQSIDSQTT